jgi:hypothetical protein
MTTRLCALVLAVLLAASSVHAEPTLVVADVQVTKRDANAFVLQVRSNGAQAFDVDGASTRRLLVVDLHGAQLGKVPGLGRQAFGRVKLKRRPGRVELRVRLRKGWTASARQGASPNTVDVRVDR